MKIVLPVDTNSMQTEICQSFGRAPYFLLYDTEKNIDVFISNTAAQSPGGAGIKAAQIIIDSGANAVLVPRLGQNACNVLKSAGIKVFKTISNGVVENINLYKNNKLSPLETVHPGFHRGN